jgi:DNA-directed RNA polymerase subunit M/transcription elongation factor TFIIS
MKFCKECNNLYFTKIIDDKLYNYCQNCGFKEFAEDPCILEKNYDIKNDKKIINYEHMCYDPTLPHTTKVSCPNKNKHTKEQDNDVVFFTDETLRLKYYCCICKFVWKQ